MLYKEDRTTGDITPTEIVSRDQVSNFLPVTFEEQILRVYARRREIEHIAHAAFKLWCGPRRALARARERRTSCARPFPPLISSRRCNLEGFQESTFFSPSRKGRMAAGAEAAADDGERADVAGESGLSSQRAHEELASQVVL